MSINTIEQDFMNKVSAKVELLADGIGRFRVLTPFQFDDGDQLAIVLKKVGVRWVLSDEGHTYMHLSYKIEEKLLHKGKRQEIISRVLSMFEVEDRNGELILDVSDARYGDALYDFVQALLKIADVSYLSKERVQSTFMEDFRALLSQNVPSAHITFDWYDTEKDFKGHYKVDCRINGGPNPPLFVYAVPDDRKAEAAAFTLLQFKVWGMSFHSVGIIADEKATSRKASAHINGVCDRCFTNINESRKEIEQYIEVYT